MLNCDLCFFKGVTPFSRSASPYRGFAYASFPDAFAPSQERQELPCSGHCVAVVSRLVFRRGLLAGEKWLDGKKCSVKMKATCDCCFSSRSRGRRES